MERLSSKNTKNSYATLEYAVLIGILVAALVAMSTYTRRALSGRWREVGDTFGFGRQYGGGAIAGRRYYCVASHIYSCIGACMWLCNPERCLYTNSSPATCFGVDGSGRSLNSMDEACSIALQEAQSKNAPCGNKPVYWCGWSIIKQIENEDGTAVLYSKQFCQ